jgi:hypothetical protein
MLTQNNMTGAVPLVTVVDLLAIPENDAQWSAAFEVSMWSSQKNTCPSRLGRKKYRLGPIEG